MQFVYAALLIGENVLKGLYVSGWMDNLDECLYVFRDIHAYVIKFVHIN